MYTPEEVFPNRVKLSREEDPGGRMGAHRAMPLAKYVVLEYDDCVGTHMSIGKVYPWAVAPSRAQFEEV